MSKINLFLIISFLLAASLTGWVYYQSESRIGDIKFDENLDSSEFILCDEDLIVQDYASYGANYRGGKKAIKEKILKETEHQKALFEGSGLIIFRFVVNCNGETGRFRVKSVDEDLEEAEFDLEQIEKLRSAIAKLEGWEPGKWENEKFDSYYQISFKIENGQITDIF